MEADYEGFSMREYTRSIRSVDIRKCCPFSGEFTGDFIQSLLPPLTVTKFRWWSHELTSLLTKSPDDTKPVSRLKANTASRPCKKRSIGETTSNDDLVLLKKKIKTKKLDDDSFNANKVYNWEEEQAQERAEDDEKCSLVIKERFDVVSSSMKKAGVGCFSYTEEELFQDSPRLVSHYFDSEFHQIPETLMPAKRKVCSVRSPDKSNTEERQVRFSLQLFCSQMNRLSLCSAEEQSPVNDETTKIRSNDDQTSYSMQLESRQVNKFPPVVSAKPVLSCFSGPHLTLERIKDALDLERKRQLAQLNQSTLSESHYRSFSSSLCQPASVDMHNRTVLNQSPLDSLLVEEAISGFPLNLQGELVEANGSSRSAAEGNDILLSNLVDLSSGRKHSAEPALVTDVGRSPVHIEKRHMYFPARLGLDETFTENAFFISDTSDGECGHTINLPKQEALSQDLSLHNTQSTMRLMGKNVSVGTGYSDMVRRGDRFIAPDPSIDYSFLESYSQQSWLWRTTTLGENHPITSLDKSWNRSLLCDLLFEPHVGLPPQARTAIVPDSELPPTVFYPCGSLMFCPSTDNNLYFNEFGLGQQLNSVTLSQQQLPFPSSPEITGLLSHYRNVGARPLLCTDSTRHSQLRWPQNFF